ncbi:MAG: T9SS type A sorting domain-containing protein [Flavobacteriales bacterium]
MERTLTLTFCIVSLMVLTTASAQTEYQEFITAPIGDSLGRFEFHKTPDGGGYIWQTATGLEPKIIRVDAAGVPQWVKEVHYALFPNYLFYGRLATTPDNGLVIWTSGKTVEVVPDSFSVEHIALKLTTSGQIEWAHRFVGPVVRATEGYLWEERMAAFADGSTIMASLWEYDAPYGPQLCVIKVDGSGSPLWSVVHELPYTPFDPSGSMALADDGSVLFAIHNAMYPELQVLKVYPNGQQGWRKQFIMNNAQWNVWSSGIVVHPSGKFVVHGHRETGLSYWFMMWFTPDGELYRHRFEEDENYGGARIWNDDGIWMEEIGGGWNLMDSMGTAMQGGFRVTSPGLIGNLLHGLSPRTEIIEHDSIWMSGMYQTTDQTFGYIEKKPFLVRSAIDPLSGCRLDAIAGYPINYIDVPDSLLDITTDAQFTPGTVSFADTAMMLVDLPLPTAYDFCTLVGVEESRSSEVNVDLWPDPVQSGAMLNIEGTQQADLTVVDASGRLVLRASELQTSRQVNTSGLEPGMYLATGSDQRGARLWTRHFVVL